MSTIRHVPKGTSYTPLERDEKKLAQVRAQLAKHGEPSSIIPDENPAPEKPCEACEGRGDAKVNGVFTGSCDACRGLGKIELSADELRVLYRDVRARVLQRKGVTTKLFDEACRNLCENTYKAIAPKDWLRAAREIERRTR